MKKHLFGVALLTCLVVTGGIASAQTIDEIQVYDAEGAPASPYDGQVVTVNGIIIERGQYSGGSHYILDEFGNGLSMYQSGSPVAIGDLVSATGTVGSYQGEIQLGSVSFSLQSSGNTYSAIPMTISEILSDYENVGMFASAIGTVVEKDGSNFFFTDGSDTLQVYIDSTTGIDLSGVDIGDTYQVTSPIVNYLGTIEMKPRFQTDLIENPGGDTLPTIAGVNCTNWVPMENDPITVNATIADDSAVASATLYYRDSNFEEVPGAWASVPMSNVGGDSWSGMIPAPHTEELVEFYLEATDDGGQTVTLPGNAPASFTTVAVGITPIYEMQYAHPDSNNQDCAYNGRYLNIRGVVTVGTGQNGIISQFIVQEQNRNPATNSYAFGAVLVYESSAFGEYYRGDLVEIGGMGDDYFGLSEMIPHNGLAVNLVDFGQDLPEASRVATRILRDDMQSDGNGALGEAWESVWVKTFPAAVQDTIGFGNFTIADKGVDSLIVSPVVELSYVPTIGEVITVESFMRYSFGDFVIAPISDEFIVLTGLTAADDTPTIVKAGGFKSIAPNPFNPSTEISFVVNKDNLVQLNVYNIRGEKVRTLVQERLPQSQYAFTWDGKNDAGQTVASGNYFARLRLGAEVVQVRKMTLVK
jgi:hypothetical protein|nr:FlgD immunoglobulin-like domain containing protein [Candidatus Krumholzibacteria bacterium]